MSDMEQSDVVDAAPVAEPVAPVEEAETPDTQDSAAVQDPTAEAPEPVVVIARTPSSESPTQEPEEDKPFSVEEAARVVVTLVRAHRTIGDADLDAAIAVLDAEYPAESEPEQA